MYEVMKGIQDVDSGGAPVTIYDYRMNTGSFTITPKTIDDLTTLCQGRSQSIKIQDTRLNTPTSSV